MCRSRVVPREPLLNTGYNEAQARISPNGRWIAYVSDSSGTQEVYVQPIPRIWSRLGASRLAAVPSRNGAETSGNCFFSHRIDR